MTSGALCLIENDVPACYTDEHLEELSTLLEGDK